MKGWKRIGTTTFGEADLARRAADGLHLAGYRVRCRAPGQRRPDWSVEWFVRGVRR